MNRNFVPIVEVVKSASTGLDAIKRAPIVDKDTGIKCLRIQDVSQRKKYDDWGNTEIEKRNFEKFQLKTNDIIVARTGASIGVNLIIKENLNSVLNNGLIRIRVDYEKCHPDYLYYNFRSSTYNDFIESISDGTSTQASVLSSLDDKIDLLHRQNKTLEAMAETLFRQWFVEEAEDCKTGKLSDEFEFTMGQSPMGASFNEEGIGVPMFQGNADFEFRFPKERVYTTEPTRFAQKFDTLISVRAPVGAQNMAQKNAALGEVLLHFATKLTVTSIPIHISSCAL